MHIKALDGVRGLAVLLVVFFHYGYVPFGWIGVQIFFVLSGFLITSILLSTRDLPLAKYLGRFYWRRSLRIFPLGVAVLLIALVVYWIWKTPPGLLSDLPYLATYTTNFGRLRQSDIDPWFVHLWSLAVEEQFYLLWPLFIYVTPQHHLKKAVAAIIFTAPIFRLAAYFYFRDQPEIVGRAIYGLPFSQFDAFGFGALIVLWKLQNLKNAGRLFLFALALAGATGSATILYMHFFGGGAFKGSLGYSLYLMPCYGFVWGYSIIDAVAMLGLVCALQRLHAFKVFENRILVYVGAISYGVYVYHVPVLEILHPVMGQGPLYFAIYLFIVLAISTASFRWLEAPFLRLKDAYLLRESLKAG
jgi:peptidoglycan/LPS O-acetylase OafA/YrhL